MFIHAFFIVFLAIGFPFISKAAFEPFLIAMFGNSDAVIEGGNMIVMVIMAAAVFIVLIVNYFITKNIEDTPVISYMGGANAGDNVHFIDSYGENAELKVSNWYLVNLFGDKKVVLPSILFSTLIIIVFMGAIIGGAL